MSTIKSKNKSLEVHLFDSGIIEVESEFFKNLGIELRLIDHSEDRSAPSGAAFRIQLYVPRENVKEKPFEYEVGYIMMDGQILTRRGQSYLKKD